MPQMVLSHDKSRLPISATATAAVGAGLVARGAGVSSFKWLATTVAGSACAATYGLGILTWWQERPGTIENNAAKALLSSRNVLASSGLGLAIGNPNPGPNQEHAREGAYRAPAVPHWCHPKGARHDGRIRDCRGPERLRQDYGRDTRSL